MKKFACFAVVIALVIASAADARGCRGGRRGGNYGGCGCGVTSYGCGMAGYGYTCQPTTWTYQQPAMYNWTDCQPQWTQPSQTLPQRVGGPTTGEKLPPPK